MLAFKSDFRKGNGLIGYKYLAKIEDECKSKCLLSVCQFFFFFDKTLFLRIGHKILFAN